MFAGITKRVSNISQLAKLEETLYLKQRLKYGLKTERKEILV